jgi:hypothetical protein
MAMPLGVLLRGYFTSGQPNAVDSILVREIRAALAEQEHQPEPVAK